ncbi:MAG: tRNA lysidine(34) synthetase TilS [Phormidesmis sp.]
MAWSLTHAQLHTLLRQRQLLPANSRILMAVSGGQDSLCLAQLLLDLQPLWDWSLAIAHCNHRWRNDAGDNAAHVLQLAKAWQVPAELAVATAPLTSEAAARRWRYETFASVARKWKCTHVVTGHTASDRAETVLYNLIRGTGTDGLSPLPWSRPLDTAKPLVTLVRPLLALRRQETGQFCQQHQLPVWEDSSNQDLRFRRNRIRQELLPYLSEHFNPKVEQALSQTAELAAADISYLEEQAARLYAQAIAKSHKRGEWEGNEWEADCSVLRAAPLALQRRVMRQLLQRALPTPPNFQQLSQLTELIQAPNGSRTSTLPGDLVAQVRKPLIWLGPMTAATD